MKEQNKQMDVIRWVMLFPAVLVTWCICVPLLGWIPHLFYRWGWVKILEYSENILAIVCGFLLPCIAMFFVARWIAPKYKNIAGWGAVAFCALWELFLIFGLLHLAY